MIFQKLYLRKFIGDLKRHDYWISHRKTRTIRETSSVCTARTTRVAFCLSTDSSDLEKSHGRDMMGNKFTGLPEVVGDFIGELWFPFEFE